MRTSLLTPGGHEDDRNAPEQGSPSCRAQYVASVLRCARLKVRKPVWCAVEVMLPIAFVGLLAWLSTLAKSAHHDGNIIVKDNDTQLPALQDILQMATCVSATPLSATVDELTLARDEILRSLVPPCKSDRMGMAETQDVVCGGHFAATWLSPRLCVIRKGMLFMLQYFNDLQHVSLLPTVDSVIIAHVAVADFLGPIESGLSRPDVMKALRSIGKIHFSPDSPATNTLISQLNRTAAANGIRFLSEGGFFGGKHPSQQDALNFFANETVDTAWALVDVGSFDRDGGKLAVTISMNKTTVPWTNKKPRRFATLGAGRDFKVYFASGFLSIEKAILDAFNPACPDAFDAAGNVAAIAPMPYLPFEQHIFLDVAGELVPLALALSFLAVVSQVAERLVQEKEMRLREAMAAMGVSRTVLYAAWLSTLFLLNALTAAGTTFALHHTFVSKTSASVLFLLLLCYALSVTTLGSLLSSFFSSSRSAAIATPILFFGCTVPSFALNADDYPETVRLLAFLSPTAFSSGLRTVLDYERNQGMGWNDVFNANDAIPFGESLVMLILDAVSYALLTWYLDHVIGGEWGVRLHPCFCFSALGRKVPTAPEDDPQDMNADDSRPHTISDAGEAYPCGQDPAVCIDRVSKRFGSDENCKVAVQRLSLNIYPAMVTAILGHNGAGKTTLCNMLTGMLPITSGDCSVYGHSITSAPRLARRHIGMCPQHNILWHDLTCYEHLHYFARVKGVPADQCRQAAEHMLREVDLQNKRDARVASLSGGQKRKLSVGIAFIGGSRLVLLDEPTAGMDVHTRRRTWDLIKRMSREQGCAVILTTHFMDEAELLGDRVCIMASGEVHSYGSTTFLKSTLSKSYTLNLQFPFPIAPDTTDRILSIVRDQGGIRGASEKEARGRELALLLPMEEVARFSHMLRLLEQRSAELQLVSLSMAAATIEDVFLAITHDHEDGDLSVHRSCIERDQIDSVRRANPEAADADDAVVSVAGTWELMASRSRHPTSAQQLAGLLRKRFDVAKRDRRALTMQVLLPVACLIFAMGLANSGPPDTPAAELSPLGLPDDQDAVAGNCSREFVAAMGRAIPTVDARANSSFATAGFLQDAYSQHGGVGRSAAIACLDSSQQELFSTSSTTTLFSNTTAFQHAAPYSLLLWYQARVGQHVGRAVSMRLWTAPLPFSQQDQAALDATRNVLMALFIVISFSFLPSVFTAFVVRERASKAKLLQMVSGAGYGLYWTSNFLFDLLSFLVTASLAFIVFAVFNRTEYVGSAATFGTSALLFLLYGLASIPTSYVLSLPFENHSTAQNAVLGIFFAGGFGLTLAGYLLQALDGPTWLLYLFRLVPPQCLGEGLIAIADAPVKEAAGESVKLLDMGQAGWPMLYLGLEAVGMALLILLADHPERARRQQMLSYRSHQQAPPIAGEAESVANEREETAAVDAKSDQALLRVLGLRKEYPARAGSGQAGVVAVRNLTFKVAKGEIFGLLGTNGAGKTSAMNVITGECLPTMGCATVAGFDVVRHAGQARQLIGYCPQFDALHELMTVDEHLALYCALRGVDDVSGVTAGLVAALGLAEYRGVTARALSGGTRRKLSVAIALVGSPRLLLLDEPTAGMDPVARRSMCELVAAASAHCAVVITTHHLEEVEALADRAAIMVGGQMQCLGSLEHLKATLGEGYQVSIRIGDERKAAAVLERLSSAYPDGSCKLVEQHLTRLRFTIKHGESTSLSALFALLHALKTQQPGEEALTVLDYTVSQSSVEEVFLAVAAGHQTRSVEQIHDRAASREATA